MRNTACRAIVSVLSSSFRVLSLLRETREYVPRFLRHLPYYRYKEKNWQHTDFFLFLSKRKKRKTGHDIWDIYKGWCRRTFSNKRRCRRAKQQIKERRWAKTLIYNRERSRTDPRKSDSIRRLLPASPLIKTVMARKGQGKLEKIGWGTNGNDNREKKN